MSLQEKEFQMRIERLQVLLSNAKEILDQEEPTKRDLLKYINRIPTLVNPIEKSRPSKKANAEEDPLKFCETASPILLDTEEVLADLNTRLSLLDDAEITPIESSRNNVSTNPPNASFGLPRQMEIKIPTFEGDYDRYPDFITSFRVATDHPAATKAHKFLVLKSHLGPKPALLLTGLDPSEDSYDKALSSLENTYNVKSRITDALHEKLINLPAAIDDAKSLRDTYMMSESLLRALEHNGVRVDENDTLRKILLRKYPQRIRDSISPMEKITLKIIRERMELIVQNKEDVESIVGSAALGPIADAPEPKSEMNSKTLETIAFAAGSRPKERNFNPRLPPKTVKICVFCKGEHYASKCEKYDTATKRRDALPENTCYSCFRFGHSSRNCRHRTACFFCRRNTHNSALCPNIFGTFEPTTREVTPKATTSNPAPTNERNVNLALNEKGTHLTARATIQDPVTNACMSIRVLLDCGSDSTYILKDYARELDLKTVDRKQLSVTVFLRDVAETVSSDAVHLKLLSNENPNFKLHVLADTVPKLPFIKTYDVNEFRVDHPKYANRKFADPANLEQVGLMLGNDYLWHLLNTETKLQVTNTLFLVNSVFGWLIVGRVPKSKLQSSSSVVCASVQEEISSLWSLDTLGIREPNYSKEKEEELALTQFYNNIQYDAVEKRYLVTWPWKTTPPNLPNNFALAKGRLLSLLKRYQNNPKYIEAVNAILAQQIQSEIIEKVPNAIPENNTHYLPFHLVINENKSTPVRIVYDGSAKTKKSNNSINDCLYKGINLLPDMIALLLRFRFESVAVIADIEKAFHQITLQQHERDFLRFMWIERNPDVEDDSTIITYRFRRVPFGIISSPFILAAVITFLLRKHPNKYTERVLQNLYVDNLITAVSDVNTAYELFLSTTQTFDHASMNIRCWTSNKKEFVAKLPESLHDTRTMIGVLGLNWNRLKDTFTITVPSLPFPEIQNTMRHVLKQSAKVYDPLGWMSPVTVRAKIMLQKMHENRYKWDQQLTQQEENTWQELYSDLQELQSIEIQRYFQTFISAQPRFQFHCFADASQRIYAAAVYLRIQHDDELGTAVHLLTAKARVAPLNKDEKLTIPRLELMGALIGSRLLNTVRQSLNLEEEIPAVLWLDSKCVLAWLNTCNELPTFVRNRVREIKNTPNLIFSYVPSAHNIADLPSRTCTAQDLRVNEAWWKGPAWLAENKENWPIQNTASTTTFEEDDNPQLKTENVVLAAAPCTRDTPFYIKLESFNSYVKLIRVTSYCIRFVRSVAKNSNNFADNQITSFDYARLLWIKAAQKNLYRDVIENLNQSRVKSLSIVKKLRLFIDSDGIIRCAGRFQNASLNDTAKYPILLPKPSDDRFTFLLVLYHHTVLKHAGTNLTLLKVRERFWFPRGKQQTYHVLTKCKACTREIAKPYRQPTESDLPDFRLTARESPFTYIGLDMCGPFTILKQAKHILITTCLVTRGVSLEVVDCLETVHIYAALRRIIARRKAPKFYLSDNMNQFLLLRQHISRSAVDDVTWKLLPEYTPWEGGAYERLIKLLKTSFYRSLRENPFCGPVQFVTVVAEIEAAINSRPLTAVDAEIGIQPLTPNHFLRVEYSPTDFEASVPITPTAAGQQLMTINKHISEVLRQFWDIWTTLYLQYLRERPATMKFQNQSTARFPRVHDVVIIRDKLKKRATWKLGKITELLQSRDGQVRAAKLQVATGNTTVRPLRDLYFMELNELEDQPSPASSSFEIDSIEVEEITV